MSNHNDFVKKLQIFALATDPIYIGTGGYNIGRVDNTIVRDPITSVPKIPGSSLAGVWRYYVVLQVINAWKNIVSNFESKKEDFRRALERLIDSYDFIDNNKKDNLKNSINLENVDISTPRNFIVKLLQEAGLKIEDTDDKELKNKKYKKQSELFKIIFEIFRDIENDKENEKNDKKYLEFEGNRFLQITCAGQDNVPQEELEKAPYTTNKEGKTGHCGHCIVCKGFGFSKRDISWQGMLFFSDLQILFFPVFTIKGTKWITTASRLKEIGIDENENKPTENKIKTQNGDEEYLNLGWLYLKVEGQHNISEDKLNNFNFENFKITSEDIIIVPEDLFSHIVNSNLEVRTSVSIDPITGAAKEGALFTSEAIPRGTIFYGEIRIFDKSGFANLEPKLKPLPDSSELEGALEDSKRYFESLGIGGMTTRGFGRLKVNLSEVDENNPEAEGQNG